MIQKATALKCAEAASTLVARYFSRGVFHALHRTSLGCTALKRLGRWGRWGAGVVGSIVCCGGLVFVSGGGRSGVQGHKEKEEGPSALMARVGMDASNRKDCHVENEP